MPSNVSKPASSLPMDFLAHAESELPLSSAYSVCVAKSRANIAKFISRPMPCAFAVDGNYFAAHEDFFDIANWTSSFFTGMSLLDFETSGDMRVLGEVNRLGDLYRDKVYSRARDTMHDLGFLYTLYSVGLYKLTGNREDRRTALRAADELARRFLPNGGYIRAWGRTDDEHSGFAGLAIIDCMMNLPLLFWAAGETGDRFYRQIAIEHADTTLRTFIRDDDSVYHAFRFDLDTGAPLGGDNYCGHAVESRWARGSAWAIYGYALAFRYTREPRYLTAATRIANKFLAQLDESGVPVWDFRLSAGTLPLRDTSAAAIAVCGLQELYEHCPGERQYADYVDSQIHVLCAEYLNGDSACPGLLRDGQVGDGKAPQGDCYRAKNAYTSWGDYFLMEALARQLHGVKSSW